MRHNLGLAALALTLATSVSAADKATPVAVQAFSQPTPHCLMVVGARWDGMRTLPAPPVDEDRIALRPVVEVRFRDARWIGTGMGLAMRSTSGIEMTCRGFADAELELLEIGQEVRLYTRPSFPSFWHCGTQRWYLVGDMNCADPAYGDWPMFCTPSADQCVRTDDGRRLGMAAGSPERTSWPALCGTLQPIRTQVQKNTTVANGRVMRVVSKRPGTATPRRPATPSPQDSSPVQAAIEETTAAEDSEKETPNRPRYPAKPKLDLDPFDTEEPNLKLDLDDAVGGYVQIGEVLVGRTPRAVAVGDINGDGLPDLVVARSGSLAVVAFLADRSGRLEQTSLLDLPWSACAMTIGEFDGDASADVAVAHCSTAEEPGNAWLILVGDGEGSLEPGASSQHPLKLKIADLNHDGVDDILALNPDRTVQEYFVSEMEVP